MKTTTSMYFDYTEVNGVRIPNLISTETNFPIGLWGERHRDYLKQYRHSLYISLKTSCHLNTYLHEIDLRAARMFDDLIEQFALQQGITEQLKAKNMLAWTQAMNAISNQAREIVYNEVIYK